MQRQVLDALVRKVVLTVVRRAVDHVREFVPLELVRVFCHLVRTQPQYAVNYFRADSSVELILVLLPRSAFEVEIFVRKLFRRDLHVFNLRRDVLAVGVSLALTSAADSRNVGLFLVSRA